MPPFPIVLVHSVNAAVAAKQARDGGWLAGWEVYSDGQFGNVRWRHVILGETTASKPPLEVLLGLGQPDGTAEGRRRRLGRGGHNGAGSHPPRYCQLDLVPSGLFEGELAMGLRLRSWKLVVVLAAVVVDGHVVLFLDGVRLSYR
jgi:hypothetical protein